MGNAVVAEELAGSDELDELYKLDASETEPEDEGDEEADEETTKTPRSLTKCRTDDLCGRTRETPASARARVLGYTSNAHRTLR